MNKMFRFHTIKKIEVDCTSYCNAFCGACDRNVNGGPTVDGLGLNHISLDIWKSLITRENLEYINEIIFNGNFGDFSMHPNFIEMIDHLLMVKNDIYVNLHTNGGARSPEFWSMLGTLLSKFTKHDIKWGIDGLENNHNLYRRGLDWNKRIANLSAFNSAGGNSIWKCIVFDYNKDIIDEISNTAKSLGCVAFQTNRNRSFPIEMIQYKEFEVGTLTSPTIDEFNRLYKRRDSFRPTNRTPDTSALPPDTSFMCPYGEDGMIQVDPWGNIWPCCYISGRQVDRNTNFPYELCGKNICIKSNSLKDITEFMSDYLYKEWKNQSIDLCNRCSGISRPIPIYQG